MQAPPVIPATADLCDRLLAEAGAIQVVAPGFRSFGGRPACAGRIVTVSVLVEGGALRLREVLSQPGEGRVLVADGGAIASWAVLGDQLSALGQQNGWAGIMLNGYVRDVRAIGAIDIAIFALGATPPRPAQFDDIARDLPLTFGGVRFVPGQWLYADEDGIVVCAGRQHD